MLLPDTTEAPVSESSLGNTTAQLPSAGTAGQRAARSRTTTVESLLAMLSLRPMSGYDLRQAIARSIGNFWQESFGQIYPALRTMVEQGLAVVQESSGDARGKKVYALTAAGRERLRAWLAEPCERQVLRDELLLKLFVGREAPVEALLGHVRTERERTLEDLARYQALETMLPQLHRNNPGLPFFLITLRNGLLWAEAQLRWCDETLVTLRAQNSQTETGPEAVPTRD